MRIIFVGDRPSKKNINQDTAFLGTESNKRLSKWITMISTELAASGIEAEFCFTNSHNQLELAKLKDLCQDADSHLIVTLGHNATKQVTCKLGLRVWHLGHPSPRNRQWNNHEYEVNQIKILTQYISAYIRNRLPLSVISIQERINNMTKHKDSFLEHMDETRYNHLLDLLVKEIDRRKTILGSGNTELNIPHTEAEAT